MKLFKFFFCAVICQVFLSKIKINNLDSSCHDIEANVLNYGIKRNLHTVVWFQVFQSNTNNLHTVIWFQVINNNPK